MTILQKYTTTNFAFYQKYIIHKLIILTKCTTEPKQLSASAFVKKTRDKQHDPSHSCDPMLAVSYQTAPALT
jgi:hypothetical protein